MKCERKSFFFSFFLTLEFFFLTRIDEFFFNSRVCLFVFCVHS